MNKYPAGEARLTEFANNTIRDARLELAAKQAKTTFRAKWKGGKPVSVQRRVGRYASNNSEALSRSLRAEVTTPNGGLEVSFFALEYWEYVDQGRKPGKGAPPQVIRNWVNSKPVRPQRGGGAGFARNTEQARKTLAFLINRKIKFFGIQGNRFFSKSLDINAEEVTGQLGVAIREDIIQITQGWRFQ